MGQKYENRPKTGTKRATRGRFMSTVVNKIRRDLMTTTEATQQTKTQPPRRKKRSSGCEDDEKRQKSSAKLKNKRNIRCICNFLTKFNRNQRVKIFLTKIIV